MSDRPTLRDFAPVRDNLPLLVPPAALVGADVPPAGETAFLHAEARPSDPEKAAEIKEQISALSKELAALRREAVLCDGIAERSGVIKEKIKAVRKDNQPERKEKTDHVQFR